MSTTSPYISSVNVKSVGFGNDQAAFNPLNGHLWFFRDSLLLSWDDSGIETVNWFKPNQPGRMLYFTPEGGVLVSMELSGEVLLSEDQGRSFYRVLNLAGANSWVQNWAIERVDPYLLLGEYHLDWDERAILYASPDGGHSWQGVFKIPDRHIHFLRSDPFSDQFFVSYGDSAKGVFRIPRQILADALGEVFAGRLSSIPPDLFTRVNPGHEGLMSIGFTPEVLLYGTDLAVGNSIVVEARDGTTRVFQLEPPFDLMSYEFLWLGGLPLVTMRLTIGLPGRNHNKPCIATLNPETGELNRISENEAFYFTLPHAGKVVTARTDQTLLISSTTESKAAVMEGTNAYG